MTKFKFFYLMAMIGWFLISMGTTRVEGQQVQNKEEFVKQVTCSKDAFFSVGNEEGSSCLFILMKKNSYLDVGGEWQQCQIDINGEKGEKGFICKTLFNLDEILSIIAEHCLLSYNKYNTICKVFQESALKADEVKEESQANIFAVNMTIALILKSPMEREIAEVLIKSLTAGAGNILVKYIQEEMNLINVNTIGNSTITTSQIIQPFFDAIENTWKSMHVIWENVAKTFTSKMNEMIALSEKAGVSKEKFTKVWEITVGSSIKVTIEKLKKLYLDMDSFQNMADSYANRPVSCDTLKNMGYSFQDLSEYIFKSDYMYMGASLGQIEREIQNKYQNLERQWKEQWNPKFKALLRDDELVTSIERKGRHVLNAIQLAYGQTVYIVAGQTVYEKSLEVMQRINETQYKLYCVAPIK